MKTSGHKTPGWVIPLLVVAGIALNMTYVVVNPRAQEKTQLPERISFVNDFAGVVDEKTKQRLEVILENLKQRTGIELDIVTVETTGSQDIFDYSRRLAVHWDVGAQTSTRKSLLLVVSVNEKAVFTQLSRSVQRQLPEGVLGDLSQRVRGAINLDHFSQGLNEGVDHFVSALGKKLGFNLQDIDQSQSVVATDNPPVPDPPPIAKVSDDPETVQATPIKTATPPETTTLDTVSRSGNVRKISTPEDDEDETEEVELTLTLPLDERVSKLTAFLDSFPNSKARPRAIELLISSYAGLGDQALRSGDTKGGIGQLMLAISEAPLNTSDKLFSGVISQIPLNLYLRGHGTEALEAAGAIETKFGADPKRLLAIAGFYLRIEQGEAAIRVATEAVKLAPDLAEAHHTLGLALHISLRLEEAVAEYQRALELDPDSKKATRRSLADLNRAAGKSEEALTLYRAYLAAEPEDKAARAGVVLSLLDLGRIEEAEGELASALKDDPRNLALLTGAAYWFAAHNNSDRALELAAKAVEVEPRYTWSQIALARALTGQKKPLEAERAIRFARQYGKFPTLDYELASVLAAAGLYEEAAEVLQQSFTLKEGLIEARLAGHIVAREPDFIRLLAPERRASLFQFLAADSADNAAMLKALLAFTIAISQAGDDGKLDEGRVAATAKEFAAGPDEMRVYRQIYAAGQLVGKVIALPTAYELTEAARSSVDEALAVPAVTVAAQADEYRDIRARAIARGGTPDIAEAPRNVLANILRGRIEDIAGWALFNQSKPDEAVEHLKRATSILPEGTPAWRMALWHLGAAYDQMGNKQEALSFYIKSYNAGDPDSGRRAVIEQLYQKTHGSLEGLDERLSAKLVAANVSPEPAMEKPAETASPTPAGSPDTQPVSSPELTPAPSPIVSTPEEAPAATPEAAPPSESSPSPSPETQVSSPERTAATPGASPSPASEPSPSPDASAESTRAATTPSPEASRQSPAAAETFPGRVLPTTVKISGKVMDADSAPMPSVVVILISPKGTVLATTTNGDGNYSFVIAPSLQSYRIIPSKDGYSFAPIDKVLAGFIEDQKGIDFVGSPGRSP